LNLHAVALIAGVFLVTGATAIAECDNPELKHQNKDADTVQRLERGWSTAFVHGDTAFEACLLTEDFTEIRSDGKINHLKDELALAEKHKGNTAPNPDGPPSTIHIHGDVAVAYGLSPERMVDGKP
jgi:hypothetical protein